MASQREIATKLFEAWSSGNADAPQPYLTDDCVLRDIVAGADKVGWPQIREFFAQGLVGAPDLVLIPGEFWTNEKGVALTWEMSATVTGDQFGPGNRGKKWHSSGMTYLEFRGDKVCLEVDYHHGGAQARSLGVKP